MGSGNLMFVCGWVLAFCPWQFDTFRRKHASLLQLFLFVILFIIQGVPKNVPSETQNKRVSSLYKKTLKKNFRKAIGAKGKRDQVRGIVGVLRCVLCNGGLVDMAFVQCPAVFFHKFCLSCMRKSISWQNSESAEDCEVFCPSGGVHDCQSQWSFMPEEITAIFN